MKFGDFKRPVEIEKAQKIVQFAQRKSCQNLTFFLKNSIIQWSDRSFNGFQKSENKETV